MYRIAICDDEAAELDKTERMLSRYGGSHPKIDFVVDRFESVDELLYLAGEKGYMPDLLLMDIYMPEKLGTEAARELRCMGNESRIIFLTISKEHALDAFGVNAAQYLVKPVEESVLFSVLDRFLKEVEEERRKFILLRVNGRIQRISLNDIVYCEAQGKIQSLCLSDGTVHKLRMTITEIFELLCVYTEFVRVGVAYIMNLAYVENINGQEVCLCGGKRIYLPRGAYRGLKERYFRYYCEGE